MVKSVFKRWKIIILLFALLGACQSNTPDKLTIAAAANMQFAMEELVTTFEKQTGISTEVILGSSGKLTAQISQGAPFDILISADMKYPTELFSKGITTGPPAIYARGQLVLWTNTGLEPSLSLLMAPSVTRIAMANPKTAPYGLAAEQILQKSGIHTDVSDKLVFGESITQTNQFIVSKAAQMGFTAMAVVRSPKMQDKGRWIVLDANDHDPIEQGIVVLNTRPSQTIKAKQFYDFIFSPSGKEILNRFGYLVD